MDLLHHHQQHVHLVEVQLIMQTVLHARQAHVAHVILGTIQVQKLAQVAEQNGMQIVQVAILPLVYLVMMDIQPKELDAT